MWHVVARENHEVLSNEENDAFKPYGNIVSLWHHGQRGSLAIDIDLTVASGVEEESDLYGLTLLPTYELAHNLIWSGDELRLAMRYHYASCNDEHGLEFNKRYEQKVAPPAREIPITPITSGLFTTFTRRSSNS